MPVADSVIPGRFLTAISHLAILVVILWSKEDNVLASLPLEHKQEEFHRVDSQLTVGLWLSMALLSIELLGFFIGASMFHMSQSLLSLCAHTCASISLSLFVTRSWDSCTFWFIFAFCSAFPATTELFLLASTLSKKKIL
uniref:transmembrane protein 107-like n=1 Tax=Myxine glutinosa TaxID=7769 RepID=UPI00358E0473